MKKSTTLAEDTAAKILTYIDHNSQLVPGSKLPNETEFCALLGVGRSTLREAIRMLSAQGVVVTKRGSGTYLCDEKAPRKPAFSLAVPSSLKDLHEARLIFEPNAAVLTCQRASEREMQEILHLGNLTEQAIRNQENRTRADQAFHRAIIYATHNTFLRELIPIVDRAIEQTIALTGNAPPFSDYTLQDHNLISQFFKERDPLGVKVAMQLHIVHAISSLGSAVPELL